MKQQFEARLGQAAKTIQVTARLADDEEKAKFRQFIYGNAGLQERNQYIDNIPTF